MKPLQFILICCLIIAQTLQAQKSEEDIFNHNIIFKDAFTNKDFKEALQELDWLILHDTNPDENVYIKGVVVLEEQMKLATDEALLDKLQLQAIGLYQQRFERFGKSPKVKNLELTKTYKYWITRPEKYSGLVEVFSTNVEAFPEMVSNPNLLAFMDIMRRSKKMKTDLTDEEIIAQYDKISSMIESRTGITDDSDLYMSKIDAIFTDLVDLDCEYIEEKYGSQLQDDMESVNSAKLYLKLALKSGCKESDKFGLALDYVNKYDPTLNLILYKAKLALSQRDHEVAEKYFGLALGYDMDANTRSDIFLYLAKLYTLKEQKPNALDFAKKAIETNGSREAHSIIGNLYLSSFSECAEGKDIVQRRAVFIAAYNQFKLANDLENMEIAKASFPSGEEIHSNLYLVGDKIEVDCWFREIVTLDKRSN